MLRLILYVGAGGMLGSILRFLTSYVFNKYYATVFPVATLLVNLSGCFIIGLLMGIFAERTNIPETWKYFFTTGICGGFTTFSAFGFETLILFREGKTSYAIAYILISILGGLLCTWAGYAAAHR